ncbi:CPBP family glutamic-type intramembrane protease [Halovulum sp. GXIMD14793]
MAVSATLFGIWHLALGSAYGVTYEGGVLALVGGGFVLGVFWTFVAFRTGKTGWTTIAHILTNIAAFTGLIASNFVG